MLKYILGALGLLLLIGLAIAVPNANEHKKITITKAITIDAPKDRIFDQLRHLERYPTWSPFIVEDPGQKYHIEGEDGKVGVSFHWEGDNEVSVGYQTITEITGNSAIQMDCTISQPFVADPTFRYTLEDTPNGVNVQQVFNLESAFADAFFMWLFDARSQMEATNQLGLDLLKKVVEEDAYTYN